LNDIQDLQHPAGPVILWEESLHSACNHCYPHYVKENITESTILSLIPLFHE
jgi:hypothetical protein